MLKSIEDHKGIRIKCTIPMSRAERVPELQGYTMLSTERVLLPVLSNFQGILNADIENLLCIRDRGRRRSIGRADLRGEAGAGSPGYACRVARQRLR